jgi:hypothetical protein
MLGYIADMRNTEFTTPEKISIPSGLEPRASVMPYLPKINALLVGGAIAKRLRRGVGKP